MNRTRASVLAIHRLLVAFPAAGQMTGTEHGEWRYWGGDEGSSRYTPAAQITA